MECISIGFEDQIEQVNKLQNGKSQVVGACASRFAKEKRVIDGVPRPLGKLKDAGGQDELSRKSLVELSRERRGLQTGVG